MASTVLPNGIIIPEKYSRDWYADLYHNWQELDNLLGGGTPKDGTLTIQKNGTTVGTFSANQATDETVNIEVPTKTSDLNNDSGFITGVSWNDVSDKPSFATVATSGSYDDLSNKPTIPTVNDATLTIQQNGTTVDTFTANSSSDKTVNIQCVDLTNNQTVGGIKTFSSQIKGTIDKSKDYYLAGNTLASENGSLGTVKYYPSSSTADLDTEIFEHSLWAPSKAVNSIPTALDLFYYVDQYFYGGRTSTSNRIQILRGYRNANLHMVRVYDNSTNSWSAWAKFADESDVVPRSGGAVLTGSLSPSIDNAYDLGDMSHYFNNGYFQNLIKIENNGLRVIYNYIRAMNISKYDTPTSSLYAQYILYKDKDGDNLAYFQYGYETNLNSRFQLKVSSLVSGNTDLIINYRVYGSGRKSIESQSSGDVNLGSGSYLFGQIYSTNATISTSDSRLKNSIKDIDDKLLDAWGNIEPKQYKFNDATEKKGEKARYHTGYLAQDIQAECEKHGVNASDYGLFCYDEWEEQEEVSEEIETEKDGKKVKEKRVIQPKREKGNSYALRYEEALVVECMYLRRCIARLTARIEELEKGNNTK